MRVSGFVVSCAVAVGCAGFAPVGAQAQELPGSVLEKSKELAETPMAKMVGRWRGEGWAMDRSGQKQTTVARERAHWNMAGTTIIVEGLGVAGEGDDLVVGHNAFGLIEMQSGKPVFYARRVGEEFEKFEIQIDKETGNVQWWRGENVRFTVTLTDMTWKEIGEYSTDGGKSWVQFMGMELHKVPGEAELKAQKVGSDADINADAGAMQLYRKAQSLMKDGKREDGYKVAQQAMKKFADEKNNLAWMLLESIEVNGKRVDVHFNMSEKERTMADGIVKPLSFRIWDEATGDLTEIIDFEYGVFEGKPVTAALGQTIRGSHLNLGTMPVDASYEDIRAKLMEIVKNR